MSVEAIDLGCSVEGAETTKRKWVKCEPGGDVELWTIQKGGDVPLPTPQLAQALVDFPFRPPEAVGCVERRAQVIRKIGETDQRLLPSPLGATRPTSPTPSIADRADLVNDEVWQEAARHYDEQGIASLTLNISTINFWNRLNVATRQVAGSVPR